MNRLICWSKTIFQSVTNWLQEREADKQIQTNKRGQDVYVKYGIVNTTSSIPNWSILSLVDGRWQVIVVNYISIEQSIWYLSYHDSVYYFQYLSKYPDKFYHENMKRIPNHIVCIFGFSHKQISRWILIVLFMAQNWTIPAVNQFK